MKETRLLLEPSYITVPFALNMPIQPRVTEAETRNERDNLKHLDVFLDNVTANQQAGV